MTTLKEILVEWDVDKVVDQTELGKEAQRIPLLHGKYLRWLMLEKDFFNKLEQKFQRLYAEKVEFYTEGVETLPEWEAKKAIWKSVPERGRTYLKANISQVLDMDLDLEEMKNLRNESKVRIEALELIMKHVMSRSYIINSMLDWEKWSGGN